MSFQHHWILDMFILDLFDLNWAQKHIPELWTFYCGTPLVGGDWCWAFCKIILQAK
jgi:hypothetical protein